MQRMILVLRGSIEQNQQLLTFLDRQQTRGAPDYHHWLTPEEFGQKFGPSPQDIQQVTSWLEQEGFSVGSVAKSGRWIEFSGTAAQVNQAFQTQMRNYQVEGKLHTANANDITIPTALAPVVEGVASLHDFHSQPMLRLSRLRRTTAGTPGKPNITFADGSHGVGPADFATIYNLGPLYKAGVNGSGQTIAIVAASNINLVPTTGIDDVATFQSIFGLRANAPNIILNGPDPQIIPGAVDEASLDVEWAAAVAPGATIDLVVSGGTLTTDPVLLSSTLIVDRNLASIVNVSFGNCEQALGSENPMWNALWEQAAAQGISVFVATGDTGAAGCDPNNSNSVAQGGLGVNGIGSTPFNTAVGGSEFNETINGGNDATFWNPTSNPVTLESAIGYIPEKVWNDSCTPADEGSICQQLNITSLASGGGGISMLYATPSWQTSSISGLGSFANRVMPDVSLVAANDHDPLFFCVTDLSEQLSCQDATGLVAAGGTSFSSPSFAGIMALVDQKLGGRQGLANFVLYSLGATESSSGFGPCNSSNQTNPAKPDATFLHCVFPDVTAGNNGVPGNDTLTVASPGNKVGQAGYNAILGFDLGTGLGSINANNLVQAWAALAAGFQGTATTLSASFNGTPLPSGAVTITHGQAVSISVSVARMGSIGTPTGNVALIAQGGNLRSSVGVFDTPITGSSGTANAGPVTVNNLPGGTNYNILANYPGDGVFGKSVSNTIRVTVGAESSTTTLNSFIFNSNTFTFSPGTTVTYGDPVNIARARPPPLLCCRAWSRWGSRARQPSTPASSSLFRLKSNPRVLPPSFQREQFSSLMEQQRSGMR
jgi:subtilase family serine protease